MGVTVSRGDVCGGRNNYKSNDNNKNIIVSTDVIVSSHTNMNPNELKRRNKEIEAEILKDQKANARIIKLLLLGTAECGKSTILKQMRILHSAGFSDSEVRLQKCSIFENILSAIVTLIEAVQNEKLAFSSEDLQIEAQMICKLRQSNIDRNCLLSPQTLLTIKRLWIEDSVQKIFANSSDYHLPDSTKYFLDDIDRIGSPSYVPTEQDILRLRIATTGINEVEFTMKNTKYRVFDVGGQRSERRKWIHCFDNVNAVIYVAALSDYNMTLAEDNHTNRLQESVKLFETICNSKWFLLTPMLLFLNKRDLFLEKIKMHPLTIAFPEYTGPQTYEDGVSFIHKKFTSVNRQQNREIYVHKTCATDTKDMEFVFDACFDIISQLSMQRSGLI